MGDLPTLRVLGWDEADTASELGDVARTLKEAALAPAHQQQGRPGSLAHPVGQRLHAEYCQVINDSKTLALALAVLAKRIRIRVNTVLRQSWKTIRATCASCTRLSRTT